MDRPKTNGLWAETMGCIGSPTVTNEFSSLCRGPYLHQILSRYNKIRTIPNQRGRIPVFALDNTRCQDTRAEPDAMLEPLPKLPSLCTTLPSSLTPCSSIETIRATHNPFEASTFPTLLLLNYLIRRISPSPQTMPPVTSPKLIPQSCCNLCSFTASH